MQDWLLDDNVCQYLELLLSTISDTEPSVESKLSMAAAKSDLNESRLISVIFQYAISVLGNVGLMVSRKENTR